MTNAPNRFELFILGPGEKALEIHEDTKIPNAASIILNKEDHTLGNMIRAQLLSDPAVIFAGYKVPHPLETKVLLKIQTNGSITPVQALEQACKSIIGTIQRLKEKFKQEFQIAGADQAVDEDRRFLEGDAQMAEF